MTERDLHIIELNRITAERDAARAERDSLRAGAIVRTLHKHADEPGECCGVQFVHADGRTSGCAMEFDDVAEMYAKASYEAQEISLADRADRDVALAERDAAMAGADECAKALAVAAAELAEARRSEKALREALRIAADLLCLSFCLNKARESQRHTDGCRKRTNVLAGVLS